MKKYYILVLVISFLFISKIDAYQEYKIGDLVKYKNVDYYVIKNSSSDEDYVSLLKAKTLKASEIEESGGNYYGDGMRYYVSDTCQGYPQQISEGCINDYNRSDIKKVVDAWANNKFDANDLKEIDGYKARLITYDELYDHLGYNNTTFNISVWVPDKENTPSFIYNIHTAYWTMTPASDTTDSVWAVFSDGSIGYTNISEYHSGYGVRPVINLNKKVIEKKDEVKNSNLTYKEYKIGDLINYNNILYYVIKKSSSSDDSLTMLKKDPLTKEEVDLYGGVGTEDNHVNMYVDDNTASYYRQAYNLNGYGGIKFFSSETCYRSWGVNTGCRGDYASSEVKYVVDAWAKANTNEDDLKEDSRGYKVRLLTYDELISDLGYVEITDEFDNKYIKASETVPNWLYNNNYWWWVITDTSDYATYSISFDGNLSSSSIHNYLNAIRPVITVKKMPIDNSTKENIDGNFNNSNNIIKVPDTLLNATSFIVFGIVLVISVIIIFVVLKTRSKK